MSKFTASKSLLERYYSGCAHQAYLYKLWNLKEDFLPKHMAFGIKVHDLIDQGIKGESLISGDKDALDRAERALNWLEKSKYTILGSEERHFAPLTDDIQVFGIIDLVAVDQDGVPVLIDWKTSSSSWTVTKNEDGESFYLGAMGWQGAMYLTQPYESSILKPSAWPDKMQYVVIPKHGTVGVYDYWKNEEDRQNLIQTCQAVKWAFDTGTLPKNKGNWTCNGCLFRRACHKTLRWKTYYNERKKK